MLKFIEDMAREAGKIALREADKLEGRITAKATDKDLVTEVDQMVEEYIVGRIQARCPGHDILGEETGRSGSSSRHLWVIDPIDGTTSYIHDHPYYSVSIALREDGKPTHGVVHAPRLNETFAAERGEGAALNGKPIKVSRRDKLGDSLLATGFACVRAELPKNNLRRFCRIVPQIRGVRRCGSAALDLSYVACGRLEGFWELNLQEYDIAAGVLLVEEAGGKVTDLLGADGYPVHGTLATNGLIHDALLAELKED